MIYISHGAVTVYHIPFCPKCSSQSGAVLTTRSVLELAETFPPGILDIASTPAVVHRVQERFDGQRTTSPFRFGPYQTLPLAVAEKVA